MTREPCCRSTLSSRVPLSPRDRGQSCPCSQSRTWGSKKRSRGPGVGARLALASGTVSPEERGTCSEGKDQKMGLWFPPTGLAAGVLEGQHREGWCRRGDPGASVGPDQERIGHIFPIRAAGVTKGQEGTRECGLLCAGEEGALGDRAGGDYEGRGSTEERAAWTILRP